MNTKLIMMGAVAFAVISTLFIVGAAVIDQNFFEPYSQDDALYQCNEQNLTTYESYERTLFGKAALALVCGNETI